MGRIKRETETKRHRERPEITKLFDGYKILSYVFDAEEYIMATFF